MKKIYLLKILLSILLSFIILLSLFNYFNLVKVCDVCVDIYKRPSKNNLNFKNNFEVLKTFIKLFLIDKTNFIHKEKDSAFFEINNFLGFDKLYYDKIIPIRCLYREIFIDSIYYFVTDKNNPFIIDCGSNRGMSILFFKKIYPNARIVAFEPYDKAFEILYKNVVSNNFKDIILINKAVSNKVGKIKFYISDETIDESFNFEKDRNNYSEYLVSTTLLSNYINEEVDLLKLDIEASELSVIEDLEQNKKLRFVKEIIMEYHHTPNLKNNKLSTLMKILEKNNFGYQIGHGLIDPFDKQFPKCFCILHAYRMN
ncbi:MAG: Methyltransferase FkbM family [candidate division TM6 bacterium GW2011_GWF2_28_16]|nr:MAG: Methyltransferase FkbM family [candidate division TM6 bacterium GW2011_GWF2_28_16]